MNPQAQEHPQVLVVGPDGIATSAGEQDENAGRERPVTEMVEQPAKVMRIGNMIRQLLEEVRAAPLDEKSRARLKEIHQSSIKELEDGLAPELVDDGEFRERFIRESQTVAAIDHPNIIPIYDAGEFEGITYIAMRFVLGYDLGQGFHFVPPVPAEELDQILSLAALHH